MPAARPRGAPFRRPRLPLPVRPCCDFAGCKGTGGLRVEIDDEVSGDLDVVGSVVLDNLTRRALIRVSIQGIYASSRMVLEVLA